MKSRHIVLALLTVAFLGGQLLADGMIVPIRPEIQVRGSWAVKYHHVNMTVRDQVASVSIDQEFVNTGAGAIEVEYLFPIPPGAAIDSMTLVVDGKEMAGKLMRAEEARQIYESIVRRKKDPALLEYVSFGLYKTRAFPLEPNKPAKVLVTYKQVCKKDRDLVEVWYPLNTEKFSSRPIESVEVTVDVKGEADITAVYSPTHDLNVERKDPRHVIAKYSAKGTLPTTDFQVFYKAADEAVGASLLTYREEDGKDGFFLLLASPNPRTAAKSVVAKDVVIVFDHSGSMSGKKIEQAKEALRFILKNLNQEDRFAVVAYNDGVSPYSDKLLPAEGKNIESALKRLDRTDAGGGTNIHEALQVAMKYCEGKAKRPQYILFLTDGLPTAGKTSEADILSDTKKANGCGARLFAFGVGYDVNVRLLDRLVEDNHGKSDYVKEKEPLEAKIASLYSKIKNPVMTDLKVEVPGVTLTDMYPRKVGDLFEGDQLLVAGRYFIEKDKKNIADGKLQTQLLVKGVYEGKERVFEYRVGLAATQKDPTYQFVEKLWAIRRVGFLLDEIQLRGQSKEVLDELIHLSLKHGIMTPYTSFLADENTRLADSRELRAKGLAAAEGLAGSFRGGAGQMDAMNRQALNEAVRAAPAASTPMTDAAGRVTGHSAAKMYGYSRVDRYEKKADEVVTTVRQTEQGTLYRRGRTWIAPNAAKVDLDKDADKIQEIKRFSDEYFSLVRANSVSENQLLATQREGEDLVIKLRGQVYRIR
ncbi:MAG: von Willebrand factor type A domain protein [Planctomycetes bacterium ADurb.Bin126]|nr:MAG: von Willebrand factor type A domain protein [Planctomycetes bacterium ADurb.Bin126]HOD83967.1 VIT domain-containing protein [Phycisphaerae bacterium]HQL72496.1 VIT domain-containing protein [Phycisphaerae bacterium]